MFWFFFSIYTIVIVLIFGFFIIAKIHVYKFRDYSVYIEPITKALAIVLIGLALIGYYLIWSGSYTPVSQSHPVQNPDQPEIY